MMISFSGLEAGVRCERGKVQVLEIANRTLFSGICQSLVSGRQEEAIEPYKLWDDEGGSLKSADAPLVIGNPFELPWSDKAIAGELFGRFEKILLEDDSARFAIEQANERIFSSVRNLTFQFEGDYAFGIEWGLSHYLKSFHFAPERMEDDRLIDNLEKFLAIAADVGLKKTLIFINLKNFLSDSDLKRFYTRVKNLNLSVLLVETVIDCEYREFEQKCGIDQHFLEY